MSDLTIYGEIGWDVSTASFHRALMGAPAGSVTVRINSPGGSVFDGLGIYSLVRNHGDVTAIIDGLAASAASVPFVGASRRVMAPGTMLMIHNPWSMVGGTAKDMYKEAETLEAIALEMAKLYSAASGGKIDIEKAQAMMDEETWLTAEQAMECGLCDEISGKATAFAKLTERTMYRKTPKEVTMSVTPTENTSKPGLFDRLVARITVDSTAVQAELTEAVAALADAAAKVTALESEKVALTTAHAAEIEAMKAEHIKALEDAKVQGAQEFAAKGLMDNSPAPLPHVEIVDESSMSHSAKWQALYDEKKFSEAAEYRKAHLKEIQEGR